jgi:hypothetical protein
MNDQRFYGYKHWTIEKLPRCFYVGKGLRKRPYSLLRSKKWHDVVSQYGLHVEICVSSLTNEEACLWEIENILKEQIFSRCTRLTENDIKCNLTTGGDGTPGHEVSIINRKKIGDAQRNKPKSVLTRQKLSQALKGRKFSDEI